MDNTNDVNYYSIICPKYDKNLLQYDCDWLFQVRKNFFTSGKKQKNKITKEFSNKVYHYSYALEAGKPMRWKRMFGDKVIEKSRINGDGSYEILFFETTRFISKIIYFDQQHSIKKIEYFLNNSETRKKALTLNLNKNDLSVIEYKNDTNNAVSYTVYPININLKNYKFAAIDKNFTTFLCLTDQGTVTYSTQEQLAALENMKKFETDENSVKNQKYKHSENNNSILENKNNEIKSNAGKNNVINKKIVCENSIERNLTYKKVIKTENNEKFYYFGQMNSELRNGKGVTLTEQGTAAYVGNYLNDKKDGFGAFCNKSGEIRYVGGFKKDKKHNIGITFDKSQNKIIVRPYKDGIAQGMVAEFDEFGNLLYAGKIENGKKVGNFASYNIEDGKLSVSQVRSDEPTLM